MRLMNLFMGPMNVYETYKHVHEALENVYEIYEYVQEIFESGVAGSIPGFTSLLDETLNRGPVSI